MYFSAGGDKYKTMITKFLYVGRLEKIKGIDILIKALGRLDRKYFGNWTLDVLGNGSLMRKFRSNDFIKFHGWADKKKVANFMKLSDCLIIPSRSESLPLVLLEAARFSLPVIAANVGDCPYLIKRYNIGLVFEKENIDSLTEKLEVLLRNGKKIFKNARFSDLERDFSLKASVQKFLVEIL